MQRRRVAAAPDGRAVDTACRPDSRRGFNQVSKGIQHKRPKVGLGLTALLPALASVACYANSIPGDFLVDDVMAVVGNGDVT